MPEIVGEDEGAKKLIPCRNCGAIISFLPADEEWVYRTDYTGDRDAYRCVRCPRCQSAIDVYSKRIV